MAENFKRTLVTCALPYANGPIHIGHLAGVYVPADIYHIEKIAKNVNKISSGPAADNVLVPASL